MENDTAHSMPPTLGGYELLGQLAEGGMATLFLARRTGVGGFRRKVVLKCILPEYTRKPEFPLMLMDEARLAGFLDHPNIVQTYEMGQESNIHYIVMEYIDGVDLKVLIRKLYTQQARHPDHYAILAGIFMQLAAGLHYAHTAVDDEGHPLNIVHRDISPTNLLISYKGQAKIVDFGIARAATQQHKTKVGVLKGKISYMSPEQVGGMEIDWRSDLFALGIVMYETITNRLLFSRSSEIETVMAVDRGPIVPPIQIAPDCPPYLQDIIFKALRRDREQRYQSAAEVHRDLQAFMQAQPTYYGPELLGPWLQSLFEEERAAFQLKPADEIMGWLRNTPAPPSTDSFTTSPSSHIKNHGTGEVSNPTLRPKVTSYPSNAGQETGPHSRSLLVVGQQTSSPKPRPSFITRDLSPPSRTMDSLPPPPEPKSSSKGLWIALVLVLVLGGAGAGAYFGMYYKPEKPISDILRSAEKLIRKDKDLEATAILQQVRNRLRSSQGRSATSAMYKARLNQLYSRIRIKPKLALVRQLMKQKKYRAALDVLRELRKRNPGVPELAYLYRQANTRLKTQPKPRQRTRPKKTPSKDLKAPTKRPSKTPVPKDEDDDD